MYCKVVNNQVSKYPYTLDNLRKDNPSVSFPNLITNSLAEEFGCYMVFKENTPDFDPLTQKIVESDVPVLTDGKWVVTKSVESMTSEEISSANEAKASYNRALRDRYLVATDWTQFNDSPLDNTAKQAWATYRQSLRDITDHANWPNLGDDDWPTKP